MHCPSLLPSPLPFAEQLRQRTNRLRCKIIRANYNTHFARNTPTLADFRLATVDLIDGTDDDTLSESFQETVHFTTYDAYAPFVSRFFEKPCKASTVIDLLAPGLPDFLVESSSTSGGLWKTFPKHNRLPKMKSLDVGSSPASDPLRRRTTAFVWNLWWDQMNVKSEENGWAATIYVTSVSVLQLRMGHTGFYLDPAKDEDRMASLILDHAAPYAAGFVKKWRSFLLIHGLFAISSRALETMVMVFINTFVEMMRYLDAEFDMIVDCITNGTIPELDGVEEVRLYLEANISPDPERAAELRKFGRPSSRPGWCSHVWPNLRSVAGTSSGSFASAVPLAQWYLGPHTDILPAGYGSSETWIGSRYNPLELNQFRLSTDDIMEFLDISEGDSINALKQLWEVEVGRLYELVLTTQDGLWRYRLGDVIEIAGFDATDGVPVISFVQRRNMAIRFPDFVIDEVELRTAMLSVAGGMLPNIVNWTATIDHRRTPETVGFFVELASEELSDLAPGTTVPDRLLDELSRSSPAVAWALEHEVFRKPTVWLVRAGTFSDFLQLKLDEGSRNVGQIKVPVVLPKAAFVTWFLDHVVNEL